MALPDPELADPELEHMMAKWGKRIVGWSGVTLAAGIASAALPATADAARQPESILPVATPASVPAPAPVSTPAPTGTPAPAPVSVPAPVAQPGVQAPIPAASPAPASAEAAVVADEPVMSWSIADAKALLGVIKQIGAEGLLPADYQPDALTTAILAGEGPALDEQASRSFAWLAEDVRDGRTRMDTRVQWFVVDPDVDLNPTTSLMEQALTTHDVAGVIAGLLPTNPDYVALKTALAATPKADKAKRNLIRVNMDRWRWLPRDMGKFYLITNVPEYQLRLTVNNNIIRTYRTIVGKPGKTATPQLAEVVEGVIFNPTWTVPQSIVVGEGLGARLVNNPKQAAREGYKVTQAKDGTIIVVQQPGANNSLGRLKLDMPNEHAIFLHDTNARSLFNLPTRALSHGCVRTERAVELGLTMAILGAGMKSTDSSAIANSGIYTRVPMTRTFPIYIMYFTMASDIKGKMATFKDIYGRDAPVLDAFAAPRKPWDGKRKSTEEVIKLDNPL